MGKAIVIAGIILVVIGLIFHFGKGLPIGKLPGDIHIKKENYSIHFPVVTCLVISIILTLILYLVNKFR